ncbi:MAG: DUF3108 domain-containing protein [Alphaproteobacteria bacterium]
MTLLRLPAAAIGCCLLPAAAWADGLALSYDVYAGGTRAVEMQARIEVAPGSYRLDAALDLVGVYAVFSEWHMDVSANGLTAGGAVVPAGFVKSSEDGERWARIAYADGVIADAQGNPSPAAEDTSTVPAAVKAAAIDPLSGIVALLLQVGAANACGGTQVLYDGKSYFTVTAVDRGPGEAPGSRYGAYSGPAILCRITVDDGAAYGRVDDDPRVADIFLAQPVAGAPFVPVRIETETNYGAVRVHLTGFTPFVGETAQAQ